jgi:hypothetical protein
MGWPHWGVRREGMIIVEITLGITAAYAVDTWQLKRWLKRERKEVWRDWRGAAGWRPVAISWIVMIVVTALAAYVIAR